MPPPLLSQKPMKKRKAKSRLTKCDLNAVMELQRKYDELQADCKDLLSVVVNLSEGKEEPRMVEFNDSNGYPNMVLDFIREHATWGKEPINNE